MVLLAQRADRSRDVRGPVGGEPVVWWLAVSAAGFLAATGLVIALALPATARWEREEQAATRRQRLGAPTGTSS